MVTLAYPQNGSFRCLSQLIYGRSMTSFGTWLFNWLLLLSTSSSFASSLPSGLPSQHRSNHRQPDLSPRTLDAGNHGFRRQASNNDGERWSDSAADELSQLSLVGSSLFAATALSPRRTQNYSDNNSKAKRFKLYLTIGCIPQNILIVDSTFRKSFSKAKRGAPAYLRAHVCASSFTSVHAAWSQLISFFLARELLSYLSIIKTCLLFNWPPIDDDLSASVTSDLLVTDSILTRIPCTKSASLKTKCVSHGRYRKLIPMTWSYRKLGVKRF